MGATAGARQTASMLMSCQSGTAERAVQRCSGARADPWKARLCLLAAHARALLTSQNFESPTKTRCLAGDDSPICRRVQMQIRGLPIGEGDAKVL